MILFILWILKQRYFHWLLCSSLYILSTDIVNVSLICPIIPDILIVYVLAVARKSIQLWESRIMSISKTPTDPLTSWKPPNPNRKTHCVCINYRVYFSLAVTCQVAFLVRIKQYWYPCSRHNQVFKSSICLTLCSSGAEFMSS